MTRTFLLISIFLTAGLFQACTSQVQQTKNSRPRVLISTDVGGTDPDDNQSMIHLLMYNEAFRIEGLVSSPSFGEGNKEEILHAIDLYEQDLPKLQKHVDGLATPDYLRSVTKQGRKGAAPFTGYSSPTEGSEWIIKCAKEESPEPLWILGWGGLEDIAQALHDAPEIQTQIRVYWIGGPNKKWSANAYSYIAANFPDLWFIECNSSYYGFFSNNNAPDSINPSNYYDRCIAGAGNLGKDFKNYYNGEIKMGDSPSLFYLMNGNPNDPTGESWGGSFEKITYSPRLVFNRTSTLSDTVAFCSVLEFHLKGPEAAISPDSICFWMEVPYGKTVQKWPGYYLGNGDYVIRYVPKKAETLHYSFSSPIAALNGLEGTVVVDNLWPGNRHPTDYALGDNWYSDKADKTLYDGKIQGGQTIGKWRSDILNDWATRWDWLK